MQQLVTYALNAYTLAGKFCDEIFRMSQLNKKERGLTRIFTKLMEMISRPTLSGGHHTIDFMFELDHFNPGGKLVEDWYTRAVTLNTCLKDSEVFQYCALAMACNAIVDLVNDLDGEETAWVLPYVLLRFVQVDDRAMWANTVSVRDFVKVLPVISFRVPDDLYEMSSTKKLQWLSALHRVSASYLPISCSGNLTVEFDTYDRRSVKAELPYWKLHTDLMQRAYALTTVYEPVVERILHDPENYASWFTTSNTYGARNGATFLSKAGEPA